MEKKLLEKLTAIVQDELGTEIELKPETNLKKIFKMDILDQLLLQHHVGEEFGVYLEEKNFTTFAQLIALLEEALAKKSV